MEDKFQEMYTQLKEEANNTLSSASADKIIQEIRSAMKERLSEIHKNIEIQKSELKQKIRESVKVQDKSIDNLKDKLNEKIDSNSPFTEQVKSMIKKLELILDKSQSLNRIQNFTDKNLADILEIKDNSFQLNKNILVGLSIKSNFDLIWNSNLSTIPNNSSIDNSNPKLLKVKANGCYNYYATDKELTNESVNIVFKTNIIKPDGFFYFGVVGSNINMKSQCLCLNIKNATYIKSTSQVICEGNIATAASMSFCTSGESTIELKINASKKTISFIVNNITDSKEYSLPSGNSWRIVSGTCNSADGYISII